MTGSVPGEQMGCWGCHTEAGGVHRAQGFPVAVQVLLEVEPAPSITLTSWPCVSDCAW